MRDDEGNHAGCFEFKFCHAPQDLASRKPVVDHDDPLGSLDELAVALGATAENV